MAGFVAGIIFWGGFNTALELTNTEKFCTSCHEMRDNVFAELKSTIHFHNRSGVRASCPDCHVPHNWTDKIARKMQASKEVWGHLFGTIDTREKFVDTGSSWRCTNGRGSRRTTRSNAATATAPSRWTSPSNRRALRRAPALPVHRREDLHRLPQGHRAQAAGHEGPFRAGNRPARRETPRPLFIL
jgi:hypothetical protein